MVRRTRDGYEISVTLDQWSPHSGIGTVETARWEIHDDAHQGAMVAFGQADTESEAFEDAYETLHDIRPEQGARQ